MSRPRRLFRLLLLPPLFMFCLFMPKPLTSKVLLIFFYLFIFHLFIMPALVFGDWLKKKVQGGMSIQLLLSEIEATPIWKCFFSIQETMSCQLVELWALFTHIRLFSAAASVKSSGWQRTQNVLWIEKWVEVFHLSVQSNKGSPIAGVHGVYWHIYSHRG